MRVTDTVTGQRLGVDEAYERFFDGFYNLGKPSEVFQGTLVLNTPTHQRAITSGQSVTRSSGVRRRGRRQLVGRK